MNKSKLIKAIACLIPFTAALLYGSGYIAQFIRNYKTWQAAGGMMGDRTSPALPSPAIGECMRAMFTRPYGIVGLGICAVAVGVLAIMVMKMGAGDRTDVDRDRNFEYSSRGTYGTSGFMSEKEMHNVFEVDSVANNKGILLGSYKNKPIFLPEETFMNKNVAVFGASGSMKSRAYVRNYIFQAARRGESLVITDPKSEMYEDMAEYLVNQGYDVKVFNLVSPQNSDSWNCIADIQGDGLMAQTFTDVVIKNTTDGKGDVFWDSASINLLKALVLHISKYGEEGKRNFGEVYNLLTSNKPSDLERKICQRGHTSPAYAPFKIFSQASEVVRSSIIIGLGAKLQVFQNESIRDITGYNEINLEEAGKRKCAYFCITSDQDSTFDFLASLFFSFLFIKLVRYADKQGIDGKLPVPVNFVLDEFPNIGAIPDFKKKISTTRSRAINISVIFQNLAQLQNRYPEGAWQEILGNCDTHLFLGCTDDLTARLISDRTGDITVSYTSKTKELNVWRVSDYTPNYREMKTIGKRKLLTPDEVLRLPVNEALVIMRGQKVLKVKKYDYTNHPHSKLMIKKKASSYIPEWRKEQDRLFGGAQEETYPSMEKPGEEKPSTENPVTGNPEEGKPVSDNPDMESTEKDTPLIVSCNPNFKKKRPIVIDEKMEAALDIISGKNDKGGDDNVPKPKHTSIDPQSILKNKK